jgi:hypothetical protein
MLSLTHAFRLWASESDIPNCTHSAYMHSWQGMQRHTHAIPFPMHMHAGCGPSETDKISCTHGAHMQFIHAYMQAMGRSNPVNTQAAAVQQQLHLVA